MLIGYENFVDESGVTFGGSAAVAGFPVTNVQAIQPSEAFRTTAVNSGVLEITFPKFHAFDLLALFGLDMGKSPELLRQSNELDQTPWVLNEATLTALTSAIPRLNMAHCWRLRDSTTVTVQHYGQQLSAIDGGTADFQSKQLSVFLDAAKPTTNGLDEIRLLLGHPTTGWAAADFNLSTGVKGSITTGGTFPFTTGSSTMASFTPIKTTLGETWYHLELTATYPSGGTFDSGLRILTLVAGSDTYTGTAKDLLMGGSGLRRTSAGAWIDTDATAGSLWRVDAVSPGSGEVLAWTAITTRELELRSRISAFVKLATVENTNKIDFTWISPGRSSIDIGRVWAGLSVALAGKLVGFSTDIEEPGGEGRSAGGQRYRGVYPVSRVHEFTLEHLTRDEAFRDIHEMYRRLGRSTPGVFVADETETTYPEEFRIYGFLEQPHPIPRQIGTVWQTRFRVLEAI